MRPTILINVLLVECAFRKPNYLEYYLIELIEEIHDLRLHNLLIDFLNIRK